MVLCAVNPLNVALTASYPLNPRVFPKSDGSERVTLLVFWAAWLVGEGQAGPSKRTSLIKFPLRS